MTFQELLDKFNGFVKKKGFVSKEPIGLISRAFPNEFNVSAGHDYALEIFKAPKPIEFPISYSLMDTCFRRIDMEHVGYSNRHLSLFNIALFACSAIKEKMGSCINELISIYTEFLWEILGFPKEKLMFTVFDGGQVLDFYLKREKSLFESLIKSGVPNTNILPLKGRRNFFLAQNTECSGPTCEIYFDRGEKAGNSRFIEIGSINFYKYLFNNKDKNLNLSVNQIFVCAIGIERTLMVLQNKSTIFDIDIIAPLVDILNKNFTVFESIIFSNSIKRIIDGIRSAVFILSEGIKPDSSSRGRILRKIIKDIKNQMKYLHLLTLDPLKDIEREVIEIYSDFYPKLKQNRVNLDKMLNFKGI